MRDRGLGILVPHSEYFTLGLQVNYVNIAGGSTGRVDDSGDPNVDKVFIEGVSTVTFEFTGRAYIPLTGNAKKKLKNWDKRIGRRTALLPP